MEEKTVEFAVLSLVAAYQSVPATFVVVNDPVYIALSYRCPVD